MAGARKTRSNKKTTKSSKQPKMTLEKKINEITLQNQEQKLKVWNLLQNTNTRGSGLLYGTTTGRRGCYVENVFADNVTAGQVFMAQGVSQETRIGNEIHSCKLNIKGYVNSNETASGTNSSPLPFEVHILVWKRKDSRGNDPVDILNYPGNTNGSITGSALSSMYSWNRKGYIIKKHKIFRMKPNPVLATSNQPNAVGIENPAYYGHGAQFFKRFSLDIPIKDSLKFDDLGTMPENEWLAFGVYIIQGNGETLLNVQQRCNVNAIASLRFKDA